MTFIQEKPKQKLATLSSVSHPLEPLTPNEIEAAVAIVRAQKSLGETTRFASVSLQEPSKETVLNFEPGTVSSGKLSLCC